MTQPRLPATPFLSGTPCPDRPRQTFSLNDKDFDGDAKKNREARNKIARAGAGTA